MMMMMMTMKRRRRRRRRAHRALLPLLSLRLELFAIFYYCSP